MLKEAESVKETSIVRQGVAMLREVLGQIPSLHLAKESREIRSSGRKAMVDFALEVKAGGASWVVVGEAKSSGQPRHLRQAALEVKEAASRFGVPSKRPRIYPVVVAPFLSEASAEICRDLGVGYADLAGNCRLTFGTVYIERRTAANPFSSKREQRSLFAPKTARVLRVLLAEPRKAWKVVDLAAKAQVSVGQVSSVRRLLQDREWGEPAEQGFSLTQPEALLDTWKSVYRPAMTRVPAYTLLHGEALDSAVKAAIREAGKGAHALLASFSAARTMAPFARVATLYLLVDDEGERIVRERLSLEGATKGENVVLLRPQDDGLLLDRVELSPGSWATSPIQTYLDLTASGERGAEAAEHLRREVIAPLWKKRR
jgi:hypothetical protein